MSVVVISNEDLNEIKKVIGYPIIPKIILEENEILDYAVKPALRDFYSRFPIKQKFFQRVHGVIEIPFPDEETYGVYLLTFTDKNKVGGSSGSSFLDIIKYQSTVGNAFTGSNYGKRFNPSGLSQTRMLKKQVGATFANTGSYNAFIDYPNRKIDVYAEMPCNLNIIFAKNSYTFDTVPFQRKSQVINLSGSYLLERLITMLKWKPSVGDIEIDIGALEDYMEDLRNPVLEDWGETITVQGTR